MAKIKLVKRKECWRLTGLGRLLLSLLIFSCISVFVFGIVGFLSQNKPVNGKILVIDGYIPDYSVKKAISIFNAGNYDLVITTGGDIASGFYLSEIHSMAELTKKVLIKLEFDSTKIIAISTGTVLKNRTLTSGIALKSYLSQNKLNQSKIDLIAIGCHSRRTKLLFAHALGEKYEVGIISIPDETYNRKKWWNSSKGVRTVISETIAYFYSYIFLTIG